MAVPSMLAAASPTAGTGNVSVGPAAVPGPNLQTVTLITGDRVTVRTAADGTVTRSMSNPNGRVAGFTTSTVGTDTYMYPDSALPYVASGQLDRGLFDITQLLSDGYDDARTQKLPLIVTYTDAAARSRTQVPLPQGATRTVALDSIQGAALSESRDDATAFWSSLTSSAASATGRTAGATPRLGRGIAKIWLDGKAEADLADTTAQIGAPQVWDSGYTGKGVDVAVLDTGIDTQHPDLTGQVASSESFVPGEDIEDHNGHGTHVASTIAGTGAASDGKEKGVAPAPSCTWARS
ncbi:S8 family serine peptidase [Streptomyces sp. NPDC007856]|uniref:S8 family serine peptidase n=1 Tax=Streptomyces sp. NPDC007856 TaxID=3364781 RepID=UPI0036989529